MISDLHARLLCPVCYPQTEDLQECPFFCLPHPIVQGYRGRSYRPGGRTGFQLGGILRVNGKGHLNQKMETYENGKETPMQQKERNEVKPATAPAEAQMRMPRKTERDVKSVSFTVI